MERERLKFSEVIKFKGDMSKERDLLDIAPQSRKILQSFVITGARTLWTCPTLVKCL